MSHSILVVDDNPSNLKLFTLLLAMPGYEVSTARNAREALAILEREQPELILMDLQLPDVDGLTLTRKLKLDPRLQLPYYALLLFDIELIQQVPLPHEVLQSLAGIALLLMIHSELGRRICGLHEAADRHCQIERALVMTFYAGAILLCDSDIAEQDRRFDDLDLQSELVRKLSGFSSKCKCFLYPAMMQTEFCEMHLDIGQKIRIAVIAQKCHDLLELLDRSIRRFLLVP